ncbi:hypothetical protein [Agromyces marinus]|uniref:Secreted protein n=1 Tax=Agromyces marinus TaxID=1389020 RepID=A0ABN6Y9Y9_9MICO|nr:hypothetical protein [Agromyces marinus]UIP57899.1 hypothetical protein DSM26151_07660 [Agromyces marinus]BDZ53904.1 hypothetical protein GCM10025870_09770 [Agromyces marinus]
MDVKVRQSVGNGSAARRRGWVGLVVALTVTGLAVPAAPAYAKPTPPPAEQPLYEVVMNGEVYDPDEVTVSPMLSAPGCTSGQSSTTHIVAWQRRRPDGVALLQCGTLSWGWRHIADRHGSDWQRIVTTYKLGGTWDQFAKWAMSGTVGQPLSAPYKASNDTYTYTAPIQNRAYNSGATAKSYMVYVPVGASNDRVITGYPVS